MSEPNASPNAMLITPASDINILLRLFDLLFIKNGVAIKNVIIDIETIVPIQKKSK